MKKSRILAAAMASVALTGALASCGKEEVYKTEENVNVCVYGPPPVYSDDGESREDGQELYEQDSSADGQEAAESQGD